MNPSSALSAVAAYRNQLKMMQQAQEGGPAQPEAAQSPFAQLVGNALSEAVDTQYKTDALQMQAMTGKVDLSDLVTAVTNAELTLNTVVTVRDRVISAYQDIVRMPI